MDIEISNLINETTFTDTYPDDEDPLEEAVENEPDNARPIIIFPSEEAFKGTTEEAIVFKWHYRAGHIFPRTLIRVSPRIEGMEELSKIKTTIRLCQCNSCQRAKSKAPQLPKATFKRSDELHYRVHCDLSGRVRTKAISGAEYFIVFVEDSTNYKTVMLMKTKDEYLVALDTYIIRNGKAMKVLRTDNAGEMLSEIAKAYYKLYRIWHEKCNAHQHFQNPRAECAIGSLSMLCRVMLAFSGAPKHYWGFALQYACVIENMFLPYRADSNITCWEKFHGEAPDIKNVRMFGCLAFAHVHKHRRADQKWDDTSIHGVFLGFAYHLGHKGCIIGSLTSRRLWIVKDPTFDEGKFPLRGRKRSTSDFWETMIDEDED